MTNRLRASDRKRILLVDRHPIFRQGLSQFIHKQPDLIVCGETDNAHSALELTEKLAPDIVSTDLVLKQSTGLDLLRALRSRNRFVWVLIISSHEERLYTEQSLRAGARGFVMKEESGAEIVAAIRRVLNGRIYLSQIMGTKLLTPILNGKVDFSNPATEKLSERELQVLQLLGQAMETRQIAERLNISVKTIETYREHLKIKLNLENSAQLIRRAVEWAQNQRNL